MVGGLGTQYIVYDLLIWSVNCVLLFTRNRVPVMKVHKEYITQRCFPYETQKARDRWV